MFTFTNVEHCDTIYIICILIYNEKEKRSSKMKKKILIALIAVCTMLFALGMINASAATYGELTYTLSERRV